MKARIAVGVGFLAGLLFANCSDPKTAYGTAIYVKVLFKTETKIQHILFIGQQDDGNDIFNQHTLPDGEARDLSSPEYSRILLNNDLGGHDFTLTVYGIAANGEYLQFGTTPVHVVASVETQVTVSMKPFEVFDAGFDGGFDAGTFDASLPDGGVQTCPCNSTCCIPDAGSPDGSSCASFGTFTGSPGGGLADLQYTLQFCGPPRTFCGIQHLCDPIRSNTCATVGPNFCSCGGGPECGKGNRCVKSEKADGGFACTCDILSNCDTCCASGPNGNTACKELLSSVACGAAGLVCEMCSAGTGTCDGTAFGPGACSASTACGGCLSATKCCSANRCLQTAWPTCRPRTLTGTLSPAACESCEFGRSNQCGKNGECTCGTEGICGLYTTCQPSRDGGSGSCFPI